jgi:hypothetical protein
VVLKLHLLGHLLLSFTTVAPLSLFDYKECDTYIKCVLYQHGYLYGIVFIIFNINQANSSIFRQFAFLKFMTALFLNF